MGKTFKRNDDNIRRFKHDRNFKKSKKFIKYDSLESHPQRKRLHDIHESIDDSKNELFDEN